MYGVPHTYLQLEEYFQYLQINEPAGYGIQNFPTTGVMGLGCGDFWDQSGRYFLATAIAKAEKRMEADRWLGFPLRRKYEPMRQLPYDATIALGKYVRGCGIETETYVDTIDLSLRTINVINDVVEFTVAVDFTDVNELIIKYPTEYYAAACKNYTIFPTCVTISSGIATVQIPRARLLKPEFFQNYVNDNERPDYKIDSFFLDTVGVYRNYLNMNTGSNLVWWRHNGGLSCNQDVFLSPCSGSIGYCSDVRQLACAYIENQRLGFISLSPATNSGTAYAQSSLAVRRKPDGVEVNFMRGYYDRYEVMDENIQRAVIAWAHNNLPERYCARCDIAVKFWQDDNKPIEPPVRIGSGRSTWGNLESENLQREFDAKHNGYRGGLL
jgi:hypothetical protein